MEDVSPPPPPEALTFQEAEESEQAKACDDAHLESTRATEQAWACEGVTPVAVESVPQQHDANPRDKNRDPSVISQSPVPEKRKVRLRSRDAVREKRAKSKPRATLRSASAVHRSPSRRKTKRRRHRVRHRPQLALVTHRDGDGVIKYPCCNSLEAAVCPFSSTG